MSDKVFTKKMTLSICLIILCLCALSISAGAFFSDSAKTGAKTFSTATYDLTIKATKQVTTEQIDDTDPANPVTTYTVEHNVSVDPTVSDPHVYSLTILPYTADLNAGYSVNITTKNGITATTSGYCKIVIKSSDNSAVLGTFYSNQIGRGTYEAGAAIQNTRALKIVTEKEITVEFIPLWGTYSGVNGSALADNAVISVSATGNVTVA